MMQKEWQKKWSFSQQAVGCLALFASLALVVSSQDDLTYIGSPYIEKQGDAGGNEISNSDGASLQTGTSAQEDTGMISLLLKPFKASLSMVRQMFGSSGRQKLRQMTFDSFVRIYNKTYSAAERPRRLAAYLRHMVAIEQNAAEYEAGQVAFKMEPNQFVDWTDDELMRLSSTRVPPESELLPEELEDDQSSWSWSSMKDDSEEQKGNGINLRLMSGEQKFSLEADSSLPAAIDWRASGCVAAPVDQGVCGSCYAVATMGAVEATKCIRDKTGGRLSAQHILDCATSRNGYNAHGCDGGWPTSVLRFLQDNSEAIRNTCYEYNGKKGNCLYSQKRNDEGCSVLASSMRRKKLSYRVLHNDNNIMAALAKYGPLATVLKTTKKLLYYSSGIMQDNSCTSKRDDVDHAVQIVGYGQQRGIKYWLIKNSWGTSWGEGGYAKIRRGYTCSIGRWGWALTG